jgi:hypothetical protein
MTDVSEVEGRAVGEIEAKRFFEREIGVTGILTKQSSAGNSVFLKFVVGRQAPIYQHALRETQKALSPSNPFRGGLGLAIERVERFPNSIEAAVLLTLLARSTRAVVQDRVERGFSVPYVPFRNQEDHQLAQPASHVVLGRRGVGKSTLLLRAIELLRESAAIVAVVDVQAYSSLADNDLFREVLQDVIAALIEDASRVSDTRNIVIETSELDAIRFELANGRLAPGAAIPRIKRCVQSITRATKNSVYLFLDDFHLIGWEWQPKLLHLLHGAFKGADGWIKVAGIRSLLNYYSPELREGLQVPGDAQIITLDLTLENPEAAESHLRAILEQFLKAVGYSSLSAVLPENAFIRLGWATAGVPRDFLQMFARALEHARRNNHAVVTVSDVNVAIGEFGQRKMDDLSQDARNSEGELRELLQVLEGYCLDEKGTNGFLLSSEESKERRLVHILSDLRLVHLISPSITPDRAGEKYEAYILDYSRFTGFRRRQNIHETVPDEGQFKASELRRLPKVTGEFLSKRSKLREQG